MLTISNNGIITVNRGDDFSIPLFINQGTELKPIRYVLTEADEVYLGISSPGVTSLFDASKTQFFVDDEVTYLGIPETNLTFDSALVRKTFTHEDLNENGDVVLKFKSIDTKFLQPGNYYYQIKIKRVENDEKFINTVVKKTSFIVLD